MIDQSKTIFFIIPMLTIKIFLLYFTSMSELILTKKKRGKPRKYDFTALKKGELVPLKGRKVKKNPTAYVAYWNKVNPEKRVEVVWDQDGNPYARKES